MNGEADTPGYHDFSWLGCPTPQIPGIFKPNQDAKAPVLCAYILLALARARAATGGATTFAELFCADGFYAMFAARFGAARAWGYDSDRDGHLASALRMRARLGIDNVDFVRCRVEDLGAERFDIVANVGGLYHVDDPRAVLEASWNMARRYLIVQNVVSMANDEPDYFERPAPGLDWGNRFSRRSFDRLVRGLGGMVVLADFNTLDANPRIEDRGSMYYLIEKPR